MPAVQKDQRPKKAPARHGKDRIVAFSDGVVAIAITLLILPLAGIDLPTSGEAREHPLTYIWDTYSTLITSFLISWFVILVFWLAHHRIFAMFDQINDWVIRWNVLWLFAVVVLPFPTSLVGQMSAEAGVSKGITAFYIGTMFVISLTLTLIGVEARRNPDLLKAGGAEQTGAFSYRGWVFAGYLALLLIVSLFKPAWALYGLVGLALMNPLAALLDKRWGPKDEDGGSATAPDKTLAAD